MDGRWALRLWEEEGGKKNEESSVAKEKPPINKLPAMPRGNPKSLDSSSHIQRVTFKEPHKSISATHKVHIGSKCLQIGVYMCARVCSHLCLCVGIWHTSHT